MNGCHDYRNLDALLDSRIRLAVVALLATVKYAEFRFLRDQTGASDGNLGAHLRKLTEAGYVLEEKAFHLRKPRTTYTLTPAGRSALDSHLHALRGMLRQRQDP